MKHVIRYRSNDNEIYLQTELWHYYLDYWLVQRIDSVLQFVYIYPFILKTNSSIQERPYDQENKLSACCACVSLMDCAITFNHANMQGEPGVLSFNLCPDSPGNKVLKVMAKKEQIGNLKTTNLTRLQIDITRSNGRLHNQCRCDIWARSVQLGIR